MTPSRYQVDIYNAIQNDSDNLVINAVAGSGKTTTIVNALKLIPDDQEVWFFAFNKHIATELQARVPSYVEAKTINSFGNQILTQKSRLNKDKTSWILEQNFDMKDNKDRSKFWKMRNLTVRIVSLSKANMVFDSDLLTDTFIIELADKYGLECPDDTDFGLIKQVYQTCLDMSGVIDFDDQIFRPLYLDMKIPKADVVMVDECQDLSPVQQMLVSKAGRRIIAVGDVNQAIYGFRGADPDSIPNLIKRLKARVLPLSICYRCPKSGIEQAQEIVPEIEASDSAPEGINEHLQLEAFREKIGEGDYVLCRTTAPLVSECLRLIRDGKKATVKGRDIGEGLKKIVKNLSSHAGESVDDFYIKLDKYHVENLERLQKRNREAEIMALNDRVETIKVLLEASKTVGEIITRIDTIFSDVEAGVIFSTVHRSKGLEAPRIFILKPELMPHPSAKKEWQQVQERNLKYVAITRVKFTKDSAGELYWVASKEKAGRGSSALATA